MQTQLEVMTAEERLSWTGDLNQDRKEMLSILWLLLGDGFSSSRDYFYGLLATHAKIPFNNCVVAMNVAEHRQHVKEDLEGLKEYLGYCAENVALFDMRKTSERVLEKHQIHCILTTLKTVKVVLSTDFYEANFCARFDFFSKRKVARLFNNLALEQLKINVQRHVIMLHLVLARTEELGSHFSYAIPTLTEISVEFGHFKCGTVTWSSHLASLIFKTSFPMLENVLQNGAPVDGVLSFNVFKVRSENRAVLHVRSWSGS